jgi:hypothetical protein
MINLVARTALNAYIMKPKLLLFLFLLIMAGCSTSKQGCPGASYQGPRYKASKFSWN